MEILSIFFKNRIDLFKMGQFEVCKTIISIVDGKNLANFLRRSLTDWLHFESS